MVQRRTLGSWLKRENRGSPYARQSVPLAPRLRELGMGHSEGNCSNSVILSTRKVGECWELLAVRLVKPEVAVKQPRAQQRNSGDDETARSRARRQAGRSQGALRLERGKVLFALYCHIVAHH